MRRILLAAAITLIAATANAQYSPFRSGYSHGVSSGYSFGVRPYYGVQQQQQQSLNWQYQQLRRQQQLFGPTIYNYDRSGRYSGYSRFQCGRLYHFDRSGRYSGFGLSR